MNNDNISFENAYKNLNLEQKSAVDTIEGPVMVVAGPGTGKTQTITLRIANIIKKTDANPRNILALTFTESGVLAMRQRLTSLIGATGTGVGIYTFHGFCAEVIHDNPDLFIRESQGDPLGDLEKVTIITNILTKQKPKILRPKGAPDHYVLSILSAISTLKREGIDPVEFEKILQNEEQVLALSESEIKKSEIVLRQRKLDKQLELSTLYAEYQSHLASINSFDFDDMINVVINALKNDENLLLTYQERYQYILIDEYQDTNSSQNELALLLSSHWGESANLFVTGDPDQAIMRFQGASIANQLTFIEHYPKAKVITLKENYRSTQTILDAADDLISHNQLRINDVVAGIDPHLHSQSQENFPIQSLVLDSGTDEISYLAKDIKERIGDGVDPSNIVIIYRNNRDALVLSSALNYLSVPFAIQGTSDVLTDPFVVDYLTILKAVEKIRSRIEDVDLFTVLNFPCFRLNPLDVLRLSRLANKNHSHLWDIISDDSIIIEAKLDNPSLFIEVRNQFSTWQTIDASSPLIVTCDKIFIESGYREYLLSSGYSNQSLLNLAALFDLIKHLTSKNPGIKIAEFLNNIDIMQRHSIRLDTELSSSRGCVTLTTAHKSKGLEWDYVYIYKCADRVWGNNKRPELLPLPSSIIRNNRIEEKDRNEEERCLFYVALTRAKRHLTLTRANRYTQATKQREISASIFLTEIESSLITERAVEVVSKPLVSLPKSSLSIDERAFLSPLVKKLELSPTSLNLYLKCPYRFKIEKVIGLPELKKPHLSYGTAIHKTLEHYYHTVKEDSSSPSLATTLDYFKEALSKEFLSETDFIVWHRAGVDVLTAYLSGLSSPTPPLYLEHKIRANLDNYTITGTLDRIEWLDPKDHSIRVIDYKTGKAKTIGEIRGETQNSEGELLRQLIFYRLLIDRDPRLSRLKFGEAVLDFVTEPLENNKSGIRKLSITTEEVIGLEKMIIEIMQKINNLEFPRTTNHKHCESCPLSTHCYPNGIPIAV